MKTANLLLGVGIEEIPDWMIVPALDDLRRRFLAALEKVQLHEGVAVETHATPRRIVMWATGIPVKQADAKETVTGPPASAGEKAAEGFARKMGIEVGQLKKTETPKGAYWSYKRKIKGRRTKDILAEVLPEVFLGIAWPKTMTWTGKSGARFIRPIRRLVAVYAGKVVPFEMAGQKSCNFATGHRRLHGDKNWDRIKVHDLESLKEGLRRNFVILDAAERRARIEQGIAALLTGGALRVRPNPKLLETLVYLTEYPTPILGGFDPKYLELPEEVLVTVMQHHQKYFSVEDAAGKLAPHFIAVMNIDGDPDGIVRHGNERVLRARFNDARFFWETDQKKKLADRVEDLKHVTFQAKLGSYYDKTQRNVEWVRKLDGNEHVQRAALLAKCDLTTELVKEFTELQGVVGGLYARAQGEPEAVAQAIYDQYEAVPRTHEGQILALADRIDTLHKFFGIGLFPSGSKDPYALRRAALGVVRILAEGPHSYSWREFLKFDDSGLQAVMDEFMIDRIRHYFREVRSYAYDEVNAALEAGHYDLADMADRLKAISQVRSTENFEPLAVSFKRIRNILLKQVDPADLHAAPASELIEAGPESDLFQEFQRLRPLVKQLKEQRNYLEALKLIASLRPRVDLFFDKVLVMTPGPTGLNRVRFLSQLLREFSTIADFSEIVISGSQPPA
jgi:glycyl-tRNA synthetase beta chain